MALLTPYRISAIRGAALGMISCVALSLSSGPADSQSSICLQLTNELAAIDSGGGFSGGSPRFREYERAVAEQKRQIAKTERAARRNGCGGLNIFRRNSPLCDRISTSLDQMYANLDDLQRNLARLAPSGGIDQARRQAVLRDIRRYGCRVRSTTRRQAEVRQTPRRRTLLEQIFGVRTYGDDGFRSGTEFDPDTGLASRYGTFRTLCVRSCDGYYFPISFSTLPQRFTEDEQTCNAMCPGSEVELYYHRMPTQDSEDMISARTDIPYTELPNAFKYREKFNAECTCRVANNITPIAGETEFTTIEAARSATEAADNWLPVPQFVGDRDLDPEARANEGGRLDQRVFDSLIPQPGLAFGERNVSSERTVRIVGPTFLPPTQN